MTTTNNNPVDSSTEDLLRFFDSFSTKKEDIIPETDLQFCKEQQKHLYESLDKIRYWYDIFRKEAEQYRETHHFSCTDSGIPNFRGYCNGRDFISPDYKRFEFKPFDVIKQLAESRFSAIRAFAEKIIEYFNGKYNVSVPVPETEIEKLALDFLPVYTDYTALVEKHLHGRGFRETAEEEIINRFHKTICHRNWSGHTPQLKQNSIVFHHAVHFDEFYFQYNKNHIHDNYRSHPHLLCEGIAFGATGSLRGNTSIIQKFDESSVTISESYTLVCGSAREMKFYKNGRIDVRFSDAASARNCFEKLQLNRLNDLNNE
jgi:hypothetical protein